MLASDPVSRDSPEQGVKLQRQGGAWHHLWAHSGVHRLSLPWSLSSGFHTGVNNEWIKIKLGQNPWRTAVIWGLQLMKKQVELKGTIEPQIFYKYTPDVQNGVYSSWRKPHGTENGMVKFTISHSDLDDNGLYYFKQPSPNQDKSLILIASEIQVKFDAGLLNFDFLGTFYDYNSAKSGSNSGKDDNWNEKNVGNFWIKGATFNESNKNLTFFSSEDNTESSVTSSSEGSALSTCEARCSSPGTNAFYAIRMTEEATYKCKCSDFRLDSVVVEVRTMTINVMVF